MAGCEQCGAPVAARSRFCTDVECKRVRARERKRASRGTVIELPAAPSVVSSVYAATLTALTSANRVDTPSGQSALILAGRLDSATSDTGSSLAALARQHLAVLDEALRDAPREADGVDELRARRLARRGTAS
jgi:predicted nucleic acid-binding Zn ribbon protein